MKPSRNETCPCGSKKKYKRCCGVGRAQTQTAPVVGAVAAPQAAANSSAYDAQAHFLLGITLRERGQYDAALKSFEASIQIRPDFIDAMVQAADILSAAGDARGAIVLFQRAVAVNPRSSELQSALGMAYLALGQPTYALTCFRLALEIDPDNARTHCNLGNVFGHLGRLQDSIVSSRRSIELDPSISEAHNNLGLALGALGEFEEAIRCYWRALSLNTSYVDALNNLGNTLFDMGQMRDAMSAYARAIEIEPSNATSHRNLGNVLLHQRSLEEAAASYKKALALKPDYAGAHLTLGMVLRQQGRTKEAEIECQAALSLQPNSPEALSFLAELNADKGQFSTSQAIFERAIALDPNFPNAWLGMAVNRRMTGDDRTWLHGVERLLANRLPLRHEIGVRYALGKYFDDLKDYERAFDSYRKANELSKRYSAPYDGAAVEQRVQHIIERFSSESMHDSRHQSNASERPVFIVGMPRSGTSLAEQILASHPGVFGAGELTFWDSAFANFDTAGSSPIPQLAATYLEHLAGYSSDAQNVVDKMPGNFMNLGLIHAAFPQAKIIHMQRHPVDTCLSIYFQFFLNTHAYSNDLEDLAFFYRQYLKLMAHWRYSIPATVLLEVPYEALVENQEHWSRRMTDFIGLPWDPQCLDFHRTDRVVTTASKWQVRQKIHARSAGRWRNYEKFLGPLGQLMDGISAESSPETQESSC